MKYSTGGLSIVMQLGQTDGCQVALQYATNSVIMRYNTIHTATVVNNVVLTIFSDINHVLTFFFCFLPTFTPVKVGNGYNFTSFVCASVCLSVSMITQNVVVQC